MVAMSIGAGLSPLSRPPPASKANAALIQGPWPSPTGVYLGSNPSLACLLQGGSGVSKSSGGKDELSSSRGGSRAEFKDCLCFHLLPSRSLLVISVVSGVHS